MSQRPKEVITMHPIPAFFIVAAILYFAINVIKGLLKRGWIKHDNDSIHLLILFGLAFFVIMFAVVMGPIIFDNIGYEITEKGSITASDSIGFILESILAATFAGLTLTKSKD